MLRIGLVTDFHYSPVDYSGRRCSQGAARLGRAMAELSKLDLEHVVTLGDLIDHSGRPASERACLAEMGGLLRTARCPVHTVLGNHDVECLDKATCLAVLGERRRRAYYAFDHLPWRLIVLDTNFHADGSDISPRARMSHWRENWLGQVQLAWIKRQLRAAGDRPVAIFAHANLDPRGGEVDGLDDHNVRDCREALDIITAAGNVQVVFQGHYHRGLFNEIEGVRFITLRAGCEGASKLSAGIAFAAEDGTVHFEGLGAQRRWL